MKNQIFLCVLSTLILSCSPAIDEVPSAVVGEWHHQGGNHASAKYAALDQIDANNFADLEIVWRYQSADLRIPEDLYYATGDYQAVPLVIDGIMYTNTNHGQVVALDPANGEELWVFDPESYLLGPPLFSPAQTRGIEYWTDGDIQRIFLATLGKQLVSIDTETGLPDLNFGENGFVDLKNDLGKAEFEMNNITHGAPPIAVGSSVIVGSKIFDYTMLNRSPPGHVRAYDAYTGAFKWRFNTIPQADEDFVETWEDDSWRIAGNTNVWTFMSADDEAGLVYLPVSTPTNDYWGGFRLGENVYAESLVALNAETGERVWHFQTVHHGLWDYDIASAPNLMDIVVDGRAIKAVAQVSKTGFTYVFDRLSGEPVWPIEERAVPQSSVPGEALSPTQPHPTRPAAFEPQGISDETLIDFTPELRAEALQNIEKFDYGPLFTPPSLRGTIQFPGWGGGAEWHGASFDPETGIYYIPSASAPIVVQLADADPADSNLVYRRGRENSVAGPQGLPLTKPPYSRITAINLNTGEHVWMVPHGEGVRQRIIDMGILDPGPVGSQSRTGPLLTKTLLFIAQRDGDRNLLRAFNKATGAIITEIDLPLPPAGTPMTYLVDGRQYVSIAVGGGADAKLITLALP